MTIPTKILAIDDEPDVTRSIRLTIAVQEPEWTVVEASSGEEGLLLLSREKPDLVLLDLRMPGMTGLETLRRIRAFSNVPVIVLTVTNNELDEVNSLEEGADDYITKPFGHLELVAHIKSVLRRTRGYETEHEDIYRDGEFSIDFSRRIVAIGSKEVLLTSTEYALLKILADNPAQTFLPKPCLRACGARTRSTIAITSKCMSAGCEKKSRKTLPSRNISFLCAALGTGSSAIRNSPNPIDRLRMKH